MFSSIIQTLTSCAYYYPSSWFIWSISGVSGNEMIAFELCASGDTLFQPLMVDWVGGPATILASEICFICWHSWWRHFFILLAAAVAITQNTRHNFHHKTWLILWSRNEFVNVNVGNSISKIFNNWIDATFISKVTNYIIFLQYMEELDWKSPNIGPAMLLASFVVGRMKYLSLMSQSAANTD